MRPPQAEQKIYHVDAEKQWEIEQIQGALQRREIWFNRDVDERVIEFLVMQLAELDRASPIEGENPAGVMVMEPEPITVYINSYGGSLYDGSAGHDAILAAKSKVVTVALGKCMSAGFHIFMAGDERVLNANSALLAHTASMLDYGKLPDLKIDVKWVGTLMRRWADAYGERTYMSAEEWLDVLGEDGLGKDWYITPEEAVERGIAHRIIESNAGL